MSILCLSLPLFLLSLPTETMLFHFGLCLHCGSKSLPSLWSLILVSLYYLCPWLCVPLSHKRNPQGELDNIKGRISFQLSCELLLPLYDPKHGSFYLCIHATNIFLVLTLPNNTLENTCIVGIKTDLNLAFPFTKSMNIGQKLSLSSLYLDFLIYKIDATYPELF